MGVAAALGFFRNIIFGYYLDPANMGYYSIVITVASYGVFSMGINIKRLHNIIFGSPYKSQIKVLQSIGRGLRLAEDKTECNLFDIADDMSYNNRRNYTLKHFEERINIYSQQEFGYEILPIKLKS